MIILDENVLEEQRQLLQSWRISVQHISFDLGHAGADDAVIIPLLHKLRRATFFTSDSDFYRRQLCHNRYCIIYLDVRADDVAYFVRRVLRHRELNTQVARMGLVVRANYSGLSVWRLHAQREEHFSWDDDKRQR